MPESVSRKISTFDLAAGLSDRRERQAAGNATKGDVGMKRVVQLPMYPSTSGARWVGRANGYMILGSRV
jgi:hypothetical protein